MSQLTQFLFRSGHVSLTVLFSGMAICMLLAGCNHGEEKLVVTEERTSSGLVCKIPIWEMGELLVKGESISFDHKFILENKSDREIRIKEVLSDCGCVVAKDYATVIAPGAESVIDVTISVFGPPGTFVKTLVVREDGDEANRIHLSIKGSRAVSSLLASSPVTVDFGQMVKGESMTKSVFVTRYDGSKVGFRDLLTNTKSVALGGQPINGSRLSPLGNPVEFVELPITLNSGSLTSGPFFTEVTVLTDSVDSSTSELKISARGVIQEQSLLFVDSIFVERLETGASVICPLFEEPRDDTCSGKVSELSYVGDDCLKVVLAEVDGVSSVRITRVGESRPSGLARGRLKVSTGGTTETEIAVSVFLPK